MDNMLEFGLDRLRKNEMRYSISINEMLYSISISISPNSSQ